MLYYYILKDPDKKNQSKVGITKDLKQRLRTYKTQCPRCTFLKSWVIDSKSREKELLNLFKYARFHVEREVVFAASELIANIVEGFILDNDLENLNTV